MAHYVTSTLATGCTSLRSWELLQLAVNDWISDEIQKQKKWISRLNSGEEKDADGKAYKARIKVQNYLAAAELITAMYNHLLFSQKQIKALKNRLELSYGDQLQLMKESELMNEIALRMSTSPVVTFTDPNYQELIRNELRTNVQFRKSVQVLVANGINEL